MSQESRKAIAQEDLNPISRVDHFYAVSSRAQELHQFLRRDLQLPEVWRFSDYGIFTSGALSLGNAVIEVMQLEGAEGGESVEAFFEGIALEPVGTAESAMAWMDERSLGHSALGPTGEIVDGPEPFRWVSFGVDVPPNDAEIFVCDYKSRDSVREGRENASRELQRSGGGPLGVRAIREIVIALADLKQGADTWASLLGQGRLGPTGVFTLSEGPAVRLVQSPRDAIHEVVLEVASLADAKTYLESKGLFGSMGDDSLTIAAQAVQGLGIRLTEK